MPTIGKEARTIKRDRAQIRRTFRRVRHRRIAVGSVLTLIILALLALNIRVPYSGTVQETSSGNVGEIFNAFEVGQTFESTRARLSGVAFQTATYSGRRNTEDVLFELRSHPNDAEPLRALRVNARALRDHQFYSFRFRPLPDSNGKTYYASLRSPTAKSGNAITLDYSAHDPYRKAGPSSLIIVRDARNGERDVLRGIKPKADLTFAVIHQIPLTERLRLAAIDSVSLLRRDAARWWVDAQLALAALLFAVVTVGFFFRMRHDFRGRLLPIILGALFVIGLFLRLLFANRLPLTNDEGTALYDARTVLQGMLPGGDGVLKTPTYVGFLGLGLSLFGLSPEAGRVVSILAGLGVTFPLISIGRALVRRGTPIAMGALWLLSAAPIVFSVYAHAQPTQLLFGVLALALLVNVLLTMDPARRSSWRGSVQALAAGVLFALALGARKSSVAFALPALVLLLASPFAWRTRFRAIGLTFVGFAVVLAFLVFLEFSLYGAPGVRYFLGIDVANIDPQTTGSPEERRSAFIKGVLPYFREGLPLTFLALVGLGVNLERYARQVGKSPRAAVARLTWLLPLLLVWIGGRFLSDNERSEYFAFGLWPFWVTMGAVILGIALLPRRREASSADMAQTRSSSHLRHVSALLPLLLPLSWLAGSAVIYASWIKFTANYLAEFLPPLALLAVSGASWLQEEFGWRGTPGAPRRIAERFVGDPSPGAPRRIAERSALDPNPTDARSESYRDHGRRVLSLLLGAFLCWGAFSALRSGYTFPHTGTFDPSSVREAARYLQVNVPKTEPVLTAALVVPVLSGHRVPLDIAHPTHYAYGFIEPAVRNVYMASAETMESTVLERVNWMLVERLTAFSYFLEYPALARLRERDFLPVAEIENLNNPLTIFRRKNLR